jgi:hypothetical protein
MHLFRQTFDPTGDFCQILLNFYYQDISQWIIELLCFEKYAENGKILNSGNPDSQKKFKKIVSSILLD